MRISDWSSDVCSSDLADRTPERLDYGVLVATLDAMQSSSATVRDQIRSVHGRVEGGTASEPLVDILLAEPDWSDAIAAQQGRFHRGARNGEAQIGRAHV